MPVNTFDDGTLFDDGTGWVDTAVRHMLRRRWNLNTVPGSSEPALWQASSAALPAGMTFVRASAGLYLSGASYAAATYASAANDVPRFDRLPSGAIGLMMEFARVGSQNYSDNFTNWTNFDALTVSAQNAAGLFTRAADRLQDTAANVEHGRYAGFSVTSAVPRASSVFLKRVTHQYVFVRGDAPSSIGACFDLLNGTVVATAASTTAIITALPDGWYRCELRWTSPGAGVANLVIAAANGAVTSIPTYVGTTTTFLAQRAQHEPDPFASSPFPENTGTGPITRETEATTQTVSHSAGGFAVAFNCRTAPGKSSGDQYLWMRSADASNWCALKRNSSGAIVAEQRSGGTTVSVTGATVADATEVRISASFALNDLGLAVNAAAATRNTSCAYPSGLVGNVFGHDRVNSNQWFGHLISGPDANGAGWPIARNDAGLQALNA